MKNETLSCRVQSLRSRHGEDEADAYDSAQFNKRDAIYDSMYAASVTVENEVKSADDLRGDWNMECIPYGSDDIRLKDLV